MYFVCMAGLGGWMENKCLHILASKAWKPKSGDPLNPHGRACAQCTSDYRSKFGCLCEVLAPGETEILYVRTEVPSEHVQDVRAMYHEEKLAPKSPEELYNQVPVAYPSKTPLIEEVSPGVARFVSYEVRAAIPEWNWNNIINLFGVDIPAAPPSKRSQQKAKKAANQAWWAEQEAKTQA